MEFNSWDFVVNKEINSCPKNGPFDFNYWTGTVRNISSFINILLYTTAASKTNQKEE